ncbi:MAG: hypothetical protein WDW38_008446 [Sanguina aurantia]
MRPAAQSLKKQLDLHVSYSMTQQAGHRAGAQREGATGVLERAATHNFLWPRDVTAQGLAVNPHTHATFQQAAAGSSPDSGTGQQSTQTALRWCAPWTAAPTSTRCQHTSIVSSGSSSSSCGGPESPHAPHLRVSQWRSVAACSPANSAAAAPPLWRPAGMMRTSTAAERLRQPRQQTAARRWATSGSHPHAEAGRHSHPSARVRSSTAPHPGRALARAAPDALARNYSAAHSSSSSGTIAEPRALTLCGPAPHRRCPGQRGGVRLPPLFSPGTPPAHDRRGPPTSDSPECRGGSPQATTCRWSSPPAPLSERHPGTPVASHAAAAAAAAEDAGACSSATPARSGCPCGDAPQGRGRVRDGLKRGRSAALGAESVARQDSQVCRSSRVGCSPEPQQPQAAASTVSDRCQLRASRLHRTPAARATPTPLPRAACGCQGPPHLQLVHGAPAPHLVADGSRRPQGGWSWDSVQQRQQQQQQPALPLLHPILQAHARTLSALYAAQHGPPAPEQQRAAAAAPLQHPAPAPRAPLEGAAPWG